MFEQDIRLSPGTGTYTQHTLEIFIMLFVAFLLGIWLGWILWNRYKQEAEKLRLDNQSLKITSETLTTELTTLRAKHSALETDNSNLSAQIVSLNRNNSNLRERVTQLEADMEETESRNRQVETELGLSYDPDTIVADDVPLEVVAQDTPDTSDTPDTPAEPDVVAPIVATVPPDNNVSVVISEGSTPLAEVIVKNTTSNDGADSEEKPHVQAEVKVSTPVEILNTPFAAAIVPTSEPENMGMAAASHLQDDLTVVEGIGPKIADLLIDASKRTQLIVTTHSDVLIDALSEQPESVLVCEKHEGQTKIHRLNRDDISHWLKDYRLGQLWTRGEIGGTRW